jgi:hypothetical protein
MVGVVLPLLYKAQKVRSFLINGSAGLPAKDLAILTYVYKSIEMVNTTTLSELVKSINEFNLNFHEICEELFPVMLIETLQEDALEILSNIEILVNTNPSYEDFIEVNE